MPGAPLLHGFSTSSSPAGEGGAARVAAASAPVGGLGSAGDVGFFVWVAIIGVVLPLIVLGGLRAGRFQFVFKGR